MEKFTNLTINGTDFFGEGYYDKSSNEIYVHAIDGIIRDTFREIKEKEIVISNIAFKGTEAEDSFTGNYQVESIYGNRISLIK